MHELNFFLNVILIKLFCVDDFCAYASKGEWRQLKTIILVGLQRVSMDGSPFCNSKFTNDCLYIPQDVVFEILSWASALELVRYKTVCKKWKSCIEEAKFINLQNKRARKGIIGTSECLRHITISTNGGAIFLSNKRQGEILGPSTCGFVCMVIQRDMYRIWNSATGMSFQLPSLQSDSYAVQMRVYQHPQSGQFHVVALCRYRSTTAYPYFYRAFLAIGDVCEWRYENCIVGTDRTMVWWAFVLCESAPICVGKFHHDDGGRSMRTFRIDPYTQETTENIAPFYLECNRDRTLCVHQWDGKFSISNVGWNEIRTWILLDEKNNKWIRETVSVPITKEVHVRFVEQGKMWLSNRSSKEVICFDLVSKRLEKITCNGTQLNDFNMYAATLATLVAMK